MAQAKLTVNAKQAKALGLLVYRKKMNPKTAIMFEPKSGVNLRQTGLNDSIEVLDSADISNLKNLLSAGYFYVTQGKIGDVTRFVEVSVTGTWLTLQFDQPVYWEALTSTANGAAGDDLIITVDGVKVALSIGAKLKADAVNSITVDLGTAPTQGVTVKLNTAGAAKIKDVGDVAVQSAEKAYTK